ncbi:phage portal protein [Hymenobacter sp. HMF4947]|uniref:Phage portal protein n=1 Tax=Hymenobacter ginkgonis TaxID=2682976 RepID=A0A7K1TKI9_9BACT|nr:phage portal protein [Hymenobacter ginkgonis]MVN78929.1 phage portal protein [Hymenobacter ginkgonis]
MSFWNRSSARSTATPLQAAVSAEREQRSAGTVESVSTESNDARLLSILGLGGATVAGVVVNQQSVMSIAAAWACVNAISQDIAGLPCQLFRQTATGRERVSDHPAINLLNLQASGLQNSFQLRQTMTAITLLRGNAYALIVRAGKLKPVQLLHKHPDETTVLKYNGRLWYRFSGDPKTYADYDVLHFRGLSLDGVMGVSVIHYFRETFGKGLAASKSHTNFYNNGAQPSGALQTKSTLSAPAQQRLADTFAFKYSGVSNAGKPLVLEEGLEYKAISLPPADAQFLETAKLTRSDIASIFRMPPHKIGDLERSTNNNIEQQSLDYVGDTLMPILLAQEQECRLKLLLPSEVETYYFRHNLAALLRSDATARGNFYAKLFQVGAFSPNDILALEDRNGIGEAGDERFIPVNMAPLSRIGELTDAAIAARKAPATPPANDPAPEND